MIRIAPHRYRLHVSAEFASGLAQVRADAATVEQPRLARYSQQRRLRRRTVLVKPGDYMLGNIVDVLCRTGDHQHWLRYERC